MKNKFILILMLIVLATISSCGIGHQKEEFVNTLFYSWSEEYEISNSEIELYFPNNSNLAYVSIEDYLNLLTGAYSTDAFNISYEQDKMLIDVSVTHDEVLYESYMIINTSLNNIFVESLDFFNIYLNETETNYSEGLISLEPIVHEGSSITYELFKYNFDVLNKNNKFYLPLAITNLLFNQGNYFDTYYNGEKLFGIDTSNLNNENIDLLLTTKNNNKKMPNDLKEANYNFLIFTIDYFYGLKEDKNINKGSDFISKTNFMKGDTDKNIFDAIIALDDLHTSHMTRGYYNNTSRYQAYLPLSVGQNVTNFFQGYNQVTKAIQRAGKQRLFEQLSYEYLDDETLIIYFTEFDVNTPNEIEAIIQDANPLTKNIIIDISFNLGGNLGAVLRMFTLMTNNEISYHLKNPLSNERVTYKVVGENPAYDNYNYYIKTSSVTFSAANLTASIAKELGIPVIGQRSSGGASAISFFVFPTGSITIMSSNTVLTNSEYQSIELGIEPNIVLNNLYDKTEILSAIQ